MTRNLPLLRTLQENQIEGASRDREVFTPGPFLLFLSTASDNPFLNYAIPRSPDFSPSTLDELVQVFRDHGRRPRLEFLEPLWLELPAALERAGFQLEQRYTLMTCAPESFHDRDEPHQVVYAARPNDLARVLRIGNSAFTEAGEIDEQEWVSSNLPTIQADHLRAALASVDGEPAASALLLKSSRVAELAGVATDPRFRRRGLASAVSRTLVRDFFRDGGELVWLTAGDEIAANLYSRLGFIQIGDQTSYIFRT